MCRLRHSGETLHRRSSIQSGYSSRPDTPGPSAYTPGRAGGPFLWLGVAAKHDCAHVLDVFGRSFVSCLDRLYACRSYYLKAASAAQCRAVVEALSNASRDARHAAEALSRMQSIQVPLRRPFKTAARDCVCLRVLPQSPARERPARRLSRECRAG